MSISGIQGLATHQLHWQNAQAQAQMQAQMQTAVQTQAHTRAAVAKSSSPRSAEPGKGQYVNKLV